MYKSIVERNKRSSKFDKFYDQKMMLISTITIKNSSI